MRRHSDADRSQRGARLYVPCGVANADELVRWPYPHFC